MKTFLNGCFTLVALLLLAGCLSPTDREATPTHPVGFAGTSTESVVEKPPSASAVLETPSPNPVMTQSLAPSITESPPTETAAVPIPTEILATIPSPVGTLLAWVFPVYGTLDPAEPLAPSISPLGAELPEGHSPARAKTVVFSSFSHEIAFVHPTEENRFSLWISDSRLEQPALAWVDDEDLTGWVGPDDLVYLRWKMNDQIILIWVVPIRGPAAGEDYWVVYSRAEGRAFELDGPCGYLAESSQTAELSVLCPVVGGRFLVLEKSGEIWESEQLPEGAIPIVDWAFSKDGARVIIATSDDELKILGADGQVLDLQTRYHPGNAIIATRVFQWSKDDSRILIFGTDERCPYSEFAGRTPPCWMIYEVPSAELLWVPAYATGSDAALSPDGNYVASFYVDDDSPLAAGYGIIYSVHTGGSYFFFAGLADTLNWEE